MNQDNKNRLNWKDRCILFLNCILYNLPAIYIVDAFVSIVHFYRKQKYFPSIYHPKTFNECLLRIKLSNESLNPLRQFVSDKELVKDYIKAHVGDAYNIKTLAILKTCNEIEEYSFQDSCVIKPTHMSSEIIIKNNPLDIIEYKKMKGWLNKNYYFYYRERNYKYLQPKIIVEELLVTQDGSIPNDYKIFCFRGVPIFIQVDFSRFGDHRRNFYTASWKPLSFSLLYQRNLAEEPKPDSLKEMLEVASKLSERFDFIRVDFYAFNGVIKVGELTNFHGSCLERFEPIEADRIVGQLFTDPRESVLDSLLLKVQ